MAASLERRNPAGGPGSDAAAVVDLPRNSAEVAARLQRRLSGFALVLGVVCRDVATLTAYAETLRMGFALADDERRELANIALRLFDAWEVINGQG